jgi:hypothetical protein
MKCNLQTPLMPRIDQFRRIRAPKSLRAEPSRAQLPDNEPGWNPGSGRSASQGNQRTEQAQVRGLFGRFGSYKLLIMTNKHY